MGDKRQVKNNDMVAYIGLVTGLYEGLGCQSVYLMWAPRTFYVYFILRYAFRVNAHVKHGLACCCIDMKSMGCRGRVLPLTNYLFFLCLLSLVIRPCFQSFQVRDSPELAGMFGGVWVQTLSYGSMCRVLPKTRVLGVILVLLG